MQGVGGGAGQRAGDGAGATPGNSGVRAAVASGDAAARGEPPPPLSELRGAGRPPAAAPRLTLGLLAASAGLGAANLYYAQPLAPMIARDFQASASGVSSALVGTQLGYAAGMLLLVPLGDVRERRGVIVATALSAAAALLGFAAAPSLALLTVASVVVGLCASLTQMMLPFAVGLVPPEDRGRVVGTVMSGLLTGVLLSRTASGMLGAAIGWRGVFVVAAGVMVGLAALLRVALPVASPSVALPYRALLGSLATIVRREPVLRRRCAVGALSFASFSAFWSTIAFQVVHGPIGGTSATAGLIGALGVTGVVVAPLAGRLAMRVSPVRVNVGALALAALAFGLFAAGGGSLVVIGVGVVMLDAGSQANMLANQTVIFGLAPAERSRINAIYMVSYFLGGALGTAVAAQAWQHGGWVAVCAVGGALSLAAMLPLRGA